MARICPRRVQANSLGDIWSAATGRRFGILRSFGGATLAKSSAESQSGDLSPLSKYHPERNWLPPRP